MARISVQEAKNLVRKGIYSDIEKLNKMTEDDIHKAALSDPDAQPLTESQIKELKPTVHRGNGVYANEKKSKH